jgi:hypothetical protein
MALQASLGFAPLSERLASCMRSLLAECL